MSQNSENQLPISTEELEQLAKDMSTPIDFDSLIAAEVLEKKGAWYKVNKFDELPEHARIKIKESKTKYKQGKAISWVKFYQAK